MEPTIAVVGGGISGLAVAYELLERSGQAGNGPQIVCLEGSDRPGGNIRTLREDGFVCEWGPNGFLDNVPATLDLVRRLGIERRLLPSNAAAAKRFLFREGRLRQLPAGPLSFLRSDVLSWKGRLRVLAEPLARRPRSTPADESVFDFAARRIGREAARVLVDAMVSGIYAGDVKALAVRSTFPKLEMLEREHGSLTRGMLALRRERRGKGGTGGPAGPGGRLTSFLDGLQEVTDHLALALGPHLRLRQRVRAVSDMGLRGFRIHMEEGAPLDVAGVVLACPAWFAATLVEAADAELARALAAISSASVTVVHLGFEAADLPAPLDGFGYLVPRGEGPRILGTLWSSSIFPKRAPEGRALLTVMLGGAHDPEAVSLPDGQILDLVRADLKRTMGLEAKPRFVRIFRHPRGIPQYTLGHEARMRTIEERLREHPGLIVCGNSYRGISLNACVEEAPRIADAAVASFRERQETLA